MSTHYPFVAIVGQDALKKALLLCAIDPSLGGVLIRGDKGVAKSTAARGLTDILLPILKTPGCAFNCAPEAPLPQCPVCQDAGACTETAPVPFVTLPLGATEDRVLGSLDFERALKEGKKTLLPGLLATAHRGLLYIDEVNLLADHLVDVLLDVAAMGVNTVQREGLALSHPAKITLLGTMNPEEGELRPQLLDRFGLMIDVTAPRDVNLRAEVVRRRLAFESDPHAFIASWQEQTTALRAQIETAQALLPKVTLADSLFHFISQLCCEFEIASLRADITLNKAARAIAALAGRLQVTAEDIHDAALLVLPHRRRHKPFEQPGLDQQRLQEMTQGLSSGATLPHPTTNNEGQSSPSDEARQEEDDPTASSEVAEQRFSAMAATAVSSMEVITARTGALSGTRHRSTGTHRGRTIRAVANEQPAQVAIDATLHHALRRDPHHFEVTQSDLHENRRTSLSAGLIVIVVDASGSMAAQSRMQAVKSSVLGLLNDAYTHRDQVAVISFRGREAELSLPPTRDVAKAEQVLDALPTGGRTPLAHALQLAAHLLRQQLMRKDILPLLVLLSDGRANVALEEDQDPWQQAMEQAGLLHSLAVPTLVVDTDQGYIRLGRTQALSAALGAEYLPMEQFTANTLRLKLRAGVK